jgi:hypothetical protein
MGDEESRLVELDKVGEGGDDLYITLRGRYANLLGIFEGR